MHSSELKIRDQGSSGISGRLYDGEKIYLGPIDYEKDPEIEARWTWDAEFMHLMDMEPARPMSPEQIKKKYEGIEKEAEQSRNLFYFTLRLRPDGRLIGYARIYWIEWSHGNAMLQLGLGDPSDRGKGYGSQALRLLMHFAFAELNLFRLSAMVPEYNQVALRLFQKAGFVEEARRRGAIHRYGRRWDLIYLGLLREEWQA